MTGVDPLPKGVLNRKAVVYVRQSTQAQVQTLALRLAPGEEGVHRRRASLPPVGELRRPLELSLADGLLVKVDRPDQRQGLGLRWSPSGVPLLVPQRRSASSSAAS